MTSQLLAVDFVLCVSSGDYPASLEPRKVYRTAVDEAALSHGLLRVFDESGDDYLYPAALFIPVQLPPAAVDALQAIS